MSARSAGKSGNFEIGLSADSPAPSYLSAPARLAREHRSALVLKIPHDLALIVALAAATLNPRKKVLDVLILLVGELVAVPRHGKTRPSVSQTAPAVHTDFFIRRCLVTDGLHGRDVQSKI
jgi:hypothetical protein